MGGGFFHLSYSVVSQEIVKMQGNDHKESSIIVLRIRGWFGGRKNKPSK